MTERTIATLFSGFEGFGVGAHAAGYTHLWGVEFNPKLAAVAERNGFHTLVDDVRAVDYASLPRPDHLHASPVCKNASVAKTDGAESPEDLETAQAVCRAIEALRPDSFSLENVRGYSKFTAFNAIVATLRRLGYGVAYAVLNSADYGVPQTRERLILRAVAGQERPVLPTPTHARADKIAPWLDTRLPWVGWLAAIADLVDALPESRFADWQLKRLPREIRESLMLSAGDAAHQHNLASAGRVVKLSPRCLARLQSFPDSYALPERAALACEGIGNAVPCLLAQRIMELAND